MEILMKKLFTLGAAVALAAGLAACSTDLTVEQKAVAEHGGLIFANSAGGKFVSCSARDSDGDGYVTCQASIPGGVENGGRRLEMTEILCAYKGAPGCKIKR